MNKTVLHSLGRSLVGITAAALMIGCADDAPLSPDQIASLVKEPQLSVCENVRAPAETKVAYRTYAQGVQIYRWNGTAWAFVAPEAVLTANANGTGVVGRHYGGPTWESTAGSKVVGAIVERCTADPNDVQWLLLRAVSAEGPGVFGRVTFIQRVNTNGGVAPSSPGSVVDEEVRMPYTTEYFFYRDK